MNVMNIGLFVLYLVEFCLCPFLLLLPSAPSLFPLSLLSATFFMNGFVENSLHPTSSSPSRCRYDLLQTSVNLSRLPVPVEATADEPSGFIFASSDFQSNPKLLVLIHGSGVVSAFLLSYYLQKCP